jgi:hypothetical protein
MYKYNFGIVFLCQKIDCCKENNKWSVVDCFGEMPSQRSRLSAVVFGDKMYVVGGATGPTRNVLLRDMYEFEFGEKF